MREYFKIGDIVYLKKGGIILSNTPHKVIAKKDGFIQIENTKTGWKQFEKRDGITKRVITISYKMGVV